MGLAPLDVSVARGVMTLTLNRPDRLNALSLELLDRLTVELGSAAQNPAVRAVVVTGAGRGFCAGQDLGALAGQDGAAAREHLRRHYWPVLNAMRALEAPVIAAVNGVAAGAGLSLALACDLRIAAQSASFAQAFVRVGLVPDAGASYFLPRMVGMAKAMEMALLGDSITAEESLRFGLVTAVVPDGELADAAAALADRLAHGPASMALIKRAFNASSDNELLEQLDLEGDLQAEAADTDDFHEGLAAFRAKRPPQFTGH